MDPDIDKRIRELTERVEFLKTLRQQVPEYWKHEAGHIYHGVFGTGGPITHEMMVRAHAFGMLKVEDLKDCKTYIGYCRNATIATWDGERKTFVIMRTKFGMEFPEETPYPHVDYCFDVFVPVCEWERPLVFGAAIDFPTNPLSKENDDG